jgi:hypothetical protein
MYVSVEFKQQVTLWSSRIFNFYLIILQTFWLLFRIQSRLVLILNVGKTFGHNDYVDTRFPRNVIYNMARTFYLNWTTNIGDAVDIAVNVVNDVLLTWLQFPFR